MHMHTLPLISQPDLMPHGSGYISTCGVLLLPRRSDSGSLLWGRLCGTIVLDLHSFDVVVPNGTRGVRDAQGSDCLVPT